MMRRKPKYEFKGGKWQPKVTEEHVLREIVDRLWFQARIKMWRIKERIPRWDGDRNLSTAGIPDLIGFIPKSSGGMYAVPLYIEVKRPRGVRRFAQEQFIQEACAGGCIAFFAESWADVCRKLDVVGIKLKEGL